mmetsp:Transcript_14676/g.43066  ORF Transcript_14676/g.43066 Transcript_14676/m.43066 type:complete len:237 (-) Transcript_14676:758-1468(-)
MPPPSARASIMARMPSSSSGVAGRSTAFRVPSSGWPAPTPAASSRPLSKDDVPCARATSMACMPSSSSSWGTAWAVAWACAAATATPERLGIGDASASLALASTGSSSSSATCDSWRGFGARGAASKLPPMSPGAGTERRRSAAWRAALRRPSMPWAQRCMVTSAHCRISSLCTRSMTRAWMRASLSASRARAASAASPSTSSRDGCTAPFAAASPAPCAWRAFRWRPRLCSVEPA